MDTCEREVGQVITSQVLLRYDMFDVVGGLSVFLAMETVSATIPGTQAHQLTGGLVHQVPPRASRYTSRGAE